MRTLQQDFYERPGGLDYIQVEINEPKTLRAIAEHPEFEPCGEGSRIEVLGGTRTDEKTIIGWLRDPDGCRIQVVTDVVERESSTAGGGGQRVQRLPTPL